MMIDSVLAGEGYIYVFMKGGVEGDSIIIFI